MVEEMSFTTQSPEETARLGETLGNILKPGNVVLLSGSLGAGKTTFCKGVARGAGVRDEVTSPTFTLAAEYEGQIPLVHMDLYRLTESGEENVASLSAGSSEQSGNQAETAGSLEDLLMDLGFDDYLEGDGALLVEWPRGVESRTPDALMVRIEQAPLPRVDERTFYCRATGPQSWKLLDEWVKRWLF